MRAETEALESRRLMSGTVDAAPEGAVEGTAVLLLPAVQKVREAAARSGHGEALPAVQAAREAAERVIDQTPA